MTQTQIEDILYDWLVTELGTRHQFKIVFDGDFVADNMIDADISATPIGTVTFNVDQETTMQALAASIQKIQQVLKVLVTGARELTITAEDAGVEITVENLIVTGGLSQPNGSVVEVVAPVAVPVVIAEQNDDTGRNYPRNDSYPFAMIRVDSITSFGSDDIRDLDPVTGVANIGGLRRATVTIDYFGPNPMSNLLQAYNSLEKETLIYKFDVNGISFLEKNDIQNITEMLETRYEERANFDFFIGFAENLEDELGIIESVEVTPTVDGEDLSPFIV